MIVRIEGGDEPPRAVVVDRDEALLGKHTECDVVLADARVSRRHARIGTDADGLWLEDLGSVNGTTVGGKPVTSRVALVPEDEVVIGPFRIRAEAGGGSPVRATETPRATRFGPLEPLLADEQVSEVMVNGPDEVFVERGGRVEETDVRFDSADDLLVVIRSIAEAAGRVIDIANSKARSTSVKPIGARVYATTPGMETSPPARGSFDFPSPRSVVRSRGATPDGSTEVS